MRAVSTHTCHGAGAAMGPAGAAVLGDVLVASRADEVGSVDVPPVPRLGQLRDLQVLMRPRTRSGNGGISSAVCASIYFRHLQ